MLWDTFLPLASLPLAVPFPCKMCQLRVSQVWGSVHEAKNGRTGWAADSATLLESAGGLVGAGRFERPTPCAQGRCATRLRYAPTSEAPLILNQFQRLRHHSAAQIGLESLRPGDYRAIPRAGQATLSQIHIRIESGGQRAPERSDHSGVPSPLLR